MTRVIHTGDTHVGYRQYNSPERRADFRRAFERVIDDAVADDAVDAVVHAGDLFHDRRPDLDDVLAVLGGLSRLAEAEVPFLAVVGNHEATRGSQWLDLFERLGLATRLGDEPVVVGDVALYGLDFVPESRRGDLDYRFAPVPDGVAGAALVAHGQFDPLAVSVRGEAWDLAEVLAAATVDFDAALLGDEHAHDEVVVDGVTATYCGSTERVSAAEREGRGYNLVTFAPASAADSDPDPEAAAAAGTEDADAGAEDADAGTEDAGAGAADAGLRVDVRRRAIETRPFVFVSVDLADGEGTDRVRDRVTEHDLGEAVVIVEVTGAGEPITPADVESAALAEGALIARVTDRRDREDDEPVESVRFADPDAAVRERLADMGLSTAARDVDEVVREDKVADSNVRETVATEVRERVDEGDLSAFARAEPDADAAAAGDADAAAPAGADAAAAGDDPTTDAEATGAAAVPDDADGGDAGVETGDDPAPDAAVDPDGTGAGGEGDEAGEAEAEPGAAERQASWGDYE